MKLCVPLCVLLVLGIPTAASAQGAGSCAPDTLGAAAGQGRNAWAANCGYVQPSAASFYDSQALYLVFTTGCGHVGCSPYIPVSTFDACIPNLVKLVLCDAAPNLNVSSDENGINVTTTAGVNHCPDFDSCDFAYASGTTVTIRPTSLTNNIDCLRFSGWSGACAGQGSTCSLALTSDVATTALWSPMARCVPL